MQNKNYLYEHLRHARPTQPVEALAKMVAELVVMHCKQKELQAQTKRQTEALENLISQSGSSAVTLLGGETRTTPKLSWRCSR